MPVDPDPRAELAEAILSMLIDRGASENGDVTVIPADQVIDALLKVLGFLLAQGSTLETRRNRRALLDGITRYLNRQILGFQQLKAEGRYRFVHAVRPSDIN